MNPIKNKILIIPYLMMAIPITAGFYKLTQTDLNQVLFLIFGFSFQIGFCWFFIAFGNRTER